MLISTYNVNSVNARLPNLLSWLEKARPDVVLLQELKCEFNAFPFFEINAVGYDVKILGQKGYNGVAVLSRQKISVVSEGLPEFDDPNARYLEVITEVDGRSVRAASVYLPNGNPPYNDPDDQSKFDYKLKFMDALYKHAQNLLQKDEYIVLGGDFNVIMSDLDVYDPKIFQNNALFREPVKQRLKAFEYLGFYDAFRTLYPNQTGYTYWDYAGGAFEQDLGLRIDYLFLSPKLADCLENCFVDKSPRAAAKSSDHTVLSATFNCQERF